MKKKVVSLMLVLSMAVAMFAGCGSSGKDSSKDEAKKDDSKGSVYYLNFKPEVDKQWQKIAKAYTEKTGVEVKVVTAASNQYETTLKSEIAGSNAPTLFQINGPVGYESWKDYCLDLTDTDLYKNLTDQSLAVKGEDGKAYGIPYTVETYGIIYNNAIMEKYFALDGAVVKSMDEINSYDKLKEVVEDMTAKKKDLGIDGVFASTSLKPGEDWRWQTHLANLPIYYEYKDNKVSDMDKIEFKYAENYKNILDLYMDNSVSEKGLLGSVDVATSMAEFALGQCAMVQNGNWAWSQISEENIASFEFIPWILGQCATVKEVRSFLGRINLCDTPFSDQFPSSSLHWLIADRSESITVECVADGMKIYDNPVGVLTNNPPFDMQLFQLNNYMQLSAKSPENHFSDKLNLNTYSRGMGALGLPGDLSSQSRFIRVAFTKMHAISDESEASSVSQFFHILGSVEQSRGCCEVAEGKYEITIYTSCCNADKGIYYYTTYDNHQISAVDMHKENLEAKELIRYSPIKEEQIHFQNGK